MEKKSPPPSQSSTATIDPAVLRATAKAVCEQDHLFFSRYFFKHRQAIKFRVNWHHELIAQKVQDVIDGRIKNLVINVPPGSSKTELVAINLMARGLALNPRARFLHISYSDDLALLNSQTARELVQSDEFQELWPLAIADDAKSKKRWNVLVDGKKAGGVYAVSLGGQITGLRASHMAEGWQGAIIIDDPLKPEEAYSKPKRSAANRKLLSTVKSRKANPDTPIIVIMQRLAQEDVDGFIQAGNMPREWEQVIIPSLIDGAYVDGLPAELQAKVDSGDRDKDGRFSYLSLMLGIPEGLAGFLTGMFGMAIVSRASEGAGRTCGRSLADRDRPRARQGGVTWTAPSMSPCGPSWHSSAGWSWPVVRRWWSSPAPSRTQPSSGSACRPSA